MQLKFDLNNDIFNIRYIQRNVSWQTLNAKQCKALMRENPSVAMKILRLYLVQKFSTKMRKFGEKLPFGKMRTSEILLEFKSLFGLNLNANLTSLKNANLANFSSQNANLTKNSPRNPAKISSKNLAKNATGGICRFKIIFITLIWFFTRKIYKFTQKFHPQNPHNSYIYARLLCGKVDLPYFELVLTTRCTLRCKHCANLMQYFSPQNAYSCSKDGILSALNSLFKVIDSVANIRIIGGEPLLFKDIAAVVAFLENENKVKSYNIVTNATIKPKDDLLSILSSSKKASVTISDYEKSPNLRIKLHKNELLRVLDERKIPYTVIWQDEDAAWFDPGAIYKRKRPRDKIVQNFRSCLMPCVSVMSNEFIGDFSENSHENLGENFNENSSLNLSKNLNSSDNLKLNFKQNLTLNSSKNSSKISASNLSKNSNFSENSSKKNQNSKGQIFICPVASSLSRLRGLREFEGDFLQIDDTLTKQKIIDFYAQDFFEVCDYCRDMWAPRKFVLPAIQSEKVLEIKE